MEEEYLAEHVLDPKTNESVSTRRTNKTLTAQPEKELLKPSRKIQKKRNKYKKIDDGVRMKLFEAVKQRGEMLKTV